MAIVDLFVKSGSSPRLSADDASHATVPHQMALLLHGDYTEPQRRLLPNFVLITSNGNS